MLKPDGKGETSFFASDGVKCTISATATAMPEDLLKWLDEHAQQVRRGWGVVDHPHHHLYIKKLLVRR